MKCKSCGYSTRKTKFDCWKKWQLCGECAVKLHPGEYDSNIRAKRSFHTLTNTPNRLQLCEFCDSILKNVRVFNGTGTVKLNVTYCAKCSIIKNNDPRIKVIQ